MNLHRKEDLPKIIAMGTNMQGNMEQYCMSIGEVQCRSF
jgi:hypothetical protein